MLKLQNNVFSKRIGYIDFLKVVGLTGIIIAHVGSPNWMNLIRSFDVPLMVILSSILGSESFLKYEKNKNGIWSYLINRVKRLVIPTWIFLIVYFVLTYMFSGKIYTLKYYIESFCLTRYGIGYVWIIMIYLYSAILIPLFKKLKQFRLSFLIIITAYILYEIAYYYKVGVNNKFIDTTFYYIVPYGLLTYLGCNFQNYNKKIHNIIISVSFIFFIGSGILYWILSGELQLVQIAKYPPRLYYLGYGILISFLLLSFCEKRFLKIYDSKLIYYVSKHSMWIYLWHILVLTGYEILGLPDLWYVKLLIIYIVSTLMVFIINKIIVIIERKKSFCWFKYLKY